MTPRLLLGSLCAVLCSPYVHSQVKPTGRIEIPDLSECSGVVQSRRNPKIYWAINDSGDGPFLYAMDRKGRANDSGSKIRVEGAKNVDWEALAMDDQGNLIVGDVGNNDSVRRDLTLYWIEEPDPQSDRPAMVERKVLIHYPDQTSFPPDRRDYDCEAIFWADGKVHLLTKRRSDLSTELYRLDSTIEDRSHPLTRLSAFNTLGPVTAADCTADGNRLAVLTYTGVWIFDRKDGSDWFSGSIRYTPLIAGQTEAICWTDDGTLLITNEQRDVYEIDVGVFSLLRE